MLSVCLAGVLAACAPAPAPASPAPTASPRPSHTPAPTATPSPAPPSATPTVTASPTDPAPPSATPWPPPTPDGQASGRRVRVPILMYHYVEPWPADASDMRRGLTVRPEDFAAQLDYLAGKGYQPVGLDQVAQALALGRPLPERAVVLTFDDGYRTLLDHALPIAQQRGFPGTVFVITELIDRGLPAYLTWDQARRLAGLGWAIAPHSKTHAELPGRGRDFQLYEMLGSLQTIEANLGVRPRFFCYPAGKYDAVTLQLAAELELWGAVTTRPGRVHTFADRFTWTRVRVDGRGTLRDFINAVDGDLP